MGDNSSSGTDIHCWRCTICAWLGFPDNHEVAGSSDATFKNLPHVLVEVLLGSWEAVPDRRGTVDIFLPFFGRFSASCFAEDGFLA